MVIVNGRSASFLIIGVVATSVCAGDGRISFNRDILPVLAENCFECHGPDSNARQGPDLRLDDGETATAWRDSGPAIVPGKPAESQLVARITHVDVERRMPPQESGSLTSTEIERIRQWIAEGAEYEPHWSLVAPNRPSPPLIEHEQWAHNAIDRFIAARFEQDGLSPSARAGRHTLLRRVTLDLTGLPPTPGEIHEFVSDSSSNAFEKVVTRLLESRQFGERMAVLWLDLARYSDTNGYSIDGGRHMWAWRDWVINAFNDNMPFDQFTIEQLAGDLLPDATTSQRVASGFNRNHMNTHEGGTIEEEYRVAYVVDRVKTTAQTWMGLTMACAQCHDHKYDPISQREYYRFFAFFNTITDRGNDGDGGTNSVPFIPVYSQEQKREISDLNRKIADLQSRLIAPDEELDRVQLVWEEQESATVPSPPTLEPWRIAGPFSVASGDEAFATDFGPENDPGSVEIDWQVYKELADGTPHPLLGGTGAWYLQRTITFDRAELVNLSFGSDDAIKVWFNGVLVLENKTQRGVAPDQERLTVLAQAGRNELLIKIVNYGGPAGFCFSLIDSGPPAAISAIITKEVDSRSDEEAAMLLAYFRSIAPETEQIRTTIASVEARLAEMRSNPMTTAMVMEEMAEPRDTFVLERGRYDMPAEKVAAGVPGCLPPLPEDAAPDRLTLAKWLVDPAHPLTARVAVNLYWQLLFGRGLVETSEDFGTSGERPSHPELLDWLAVEFIESGWDIKHMLRLMVMSATYQQESIVSDELLEQDPENRFLARGPRFRLDAEFVRDLAIASSGLLVKKIGGPSVRPYQPPGLWKEMSHFGSTPATEQVYTQDSGDMLYRRSLYTIHKRTVPPPPMVAFDAPNREVCTVRRARTNTPLQALVLLNETGFVEAARALGERIMQEGGETTADRVRFGFLLVISREPTSHEIEIVVNAFERERRRFVEEPVQARELLSVGDSARDTSLDFAEQAAWTVVANLLLNLSETVTKG